jgi:ribosomal protein L3
MEEWWNVRQLGASEAQRSERRLAGSLAQAATSVVVVYRNLDGCQAGNHTRF